MNCDQIAKLLPDYLQGNLTADPDDAVEQHLEHCANCAEQAALWKELALLPIEHASPSLRTRFNAMLAAFQEGQAQKPLGASRSWLWIPTGSSNKLRLTAATVAWTLAFLVIGFFAGRHWRGESRTPELAAMHAELTSMRQLVVLSMLQQQSASERLEGVTWSTHSQQADPQILDALLHTLRHDPSVDVRLAALDALSRHSKQPRVRAALLDALQAQQSPLVQVALIDFLVETHDPAAREKLEKLRQQPDVNLAVRERADWAIRNLN